MAQKSWPRGAPTRAATASIAVTPGTIATSSLRQPPSPRSICSHTAAAIANTPGSPPETSATCAPCAAAALRHAAQGAHVALVSGGDPGVFAMAAAVCEQIDRGEAAWRKLDVAIVP